MLGPEKREQQHLIARCQISNKKKIFMVCLSKGIILRVETNKKKLQYTRELLS